VAFRIHNHNNPQVGALWEELISRLAAVNLRMIRQTYRDLGDVIAAQPGSDNVPRIERTRAFLGGLIAQRESSEA
jgi:hypothetical protein